MSDVVITYETIFELLRSERNKNELQQLDINFYSDLVNYLKDKQEIMNKDTESIFAQQDMKKTQIELTNIRKMIKELYERREKKIVGLALIKSRTNSAIIDTSSLLNEEKLLFEYLIGIFDKYRVKILDKVLNLEKPSLDEEKEIAKKEKKVNTTVRFLSAIPKFVDRDMMIYGPFNVEDIANLPTEITTILVAKKRAEELDV